ncbi:MAG: hypothetical protein SGI87_00895 [Flavobacteriales bacterium]|nr:hypothetical protein [Flavobacteriales bacterium]
MATAKEKLDIIEWIVQQDDVAVLKKFQDLIQQLESEKFSNTKVIGQKPNGTRVSRTELVNTFDLALRQYREGQILTLEELDDLSETW